MARKGDALMDMQVTEGSGKKKDRQKAVSPESSSQ
jgi:hypothetical protein